MTLLLRCLRDVRARAGGADLLPPPALDGGATPADTPYLPTLATRQARAPARPATAKDTDRDSTLKPSP